MGVLTKGLLIYLFIAIAIAFSAPTVIFGNGTPQDNSVLSFFHVTQDNNGYPIVGNATLNGAASTQTSNMQTPSVAQAGSVLGFIDPIFQVLGWFGILFKILFSPVILLGSAAFVGAPPAIMWIIGIPLTFLVLLGLIWLIRGIPQ